MVNKRIVIKLIETYFPKVFDNLKPLYKPIQVEDLETIFCKSNDFDVPNINKDFLYGSPEENILFFKDVTSPEARNVKNSM